MRFSRRKGQLGSIPTHPLGDGKGGTRENEGVLVRFAQVSSLRLRATADHLSHRQTTTCPTGKQSLQTRQSVSKQKQRGCQAHTYFQDRPLFDNNSVVALDGFAVFRRNSFKDEYSICQAAGRGVCGESRGREGLGGPAAAGALEAALARTAFINNPNQNIF